MLYTHTTHLPRIMVNGVELLVFTKSLYMINDSFVVTMHTYTCHYLPRIAQIYTQQICWQIIGLYMTPIGSQKDPHDWRTLSEWAGTHLVHMDEEGVVRTFTIVTYYNIMGS